MSTTKLARLFAELVGTFALTAVVIAVTRNYSNPLFVTISAAATYAVLVSALGPVSGGHFNPALTLGMFSVRKIKLIEAVFYVAMQVVGAVLAWKLFDYLSNERAITSSTQEFDARVFVAEIVGTALFAMGVAAATTRKFVGGHLGATVGLSFFVGSVAMAVVIVDRQLAGGVLNPAVALGIGFRPSADSYLAYYFGPVLGAIAGMYAYKLFFSDEKVTVAAAPAAKTVATPVVETKKVVKKKAAPKRKPAAKKTTSRRTR